MPDTKLKAYEQEAAQKDKARNDSTINAVTLQLDTVTAPAEPTLPDEIQNSAAAYQQAQASLQDFYVPEYNESAQVAKFRHGSMSWRCRTLWHSNSRNNPMKWSCLKVVSVGAQYMVMEMLAMSRLHKSMRKESGMSTGAECYPQCRIDVECRHKRESFNTSVGMKRSSARIQSPPSLPQPVRYQRAVSEVENHRTDVDRQQAHTP